MSVEELVLEMHPYSWRCSEDALEGDEDKVFNPAASSPEVLDNSLICPVGDVRPMAGQALSRGLATGAEVLEGRCLGRPEQVKESSLGLAVQFSFNGDHYPS